MYSPEGVLATPVPSSEADASLLRSPRHDKSSVPWTNRTAPVATPPPTSSPSRAVRTRDNVEWKRSGVSPTKREHRDRIDLPRFAEPMHAPFEIRLEHEPDEPVMLNYHHTFLIGRCKRPESMPAALRDSRTFVGARPLAMVSLPPSAVHASRLHALIRWVPFTHVGDGGQVPVGAFVLRVIGQNGLIIDGRRYQSGHIVRLDATRTWLDFFGMKVCFEMPHMPGRVVSMRPQTTSVSPMKRARASSPGMLADVPSSPSRWTDWHTDGEGATHHQRSSLPSPTFSPSVLRSQSSSPSPLPSSPVMSPSHSHSHPHTLPTSCQEVPAYAPASASPAQTAKRHVDQDGTSLLGTTSAHMPECMPKSQEQGPVPASSTAKAVLLKEASESEDESQQEDQAKATCVSRSNQPSKSLDTARSLVARLAPTYDLAGLLAGAIVFHRTATISASEAVRSVLASNPSMLRGEAGACAIAYSPSKSRLWTDDESSAFPAYGEQIKGWFPTSDSRWSSLTRHAWYERLDEELQRAPMFGVIQRPGKDTRGDPLECWYYYDKDNDPDIERAQNLGAFVKPMRNAVRSQKPIFWKKSEYGRATSHNGAVGADDDKVPYSPRGSSGSDGESTKRSRKSDRIDTTLEEPEKTWDRLGDQPWSSTSSRPRKKRSVAKEAL